MELLVVVLLVVVIAALAFAVFQTRRQRDAIASNRLRRGTPSPLPRQSRRARRHPMADAVQEHAAATDPQEVVAAEQRLQAEASRVASGLKADAHRDEYARADDQVADGAPHADPRLDGYRDGADPYADPRYDGRPAGNPVDPREDPRLR
jgi:hypothetical protein